MVEAETFLSKIAGSVHEVCSFTSYVDAVCCNSFTNLISQYNFGYGKEF